MFLYSVYSQRHVENLTVKRKNIIEGEQKKGVYKKTEKKTEIGVTLLLLQNSKSDEHHEKSQIFIKSPHKK